MVRVGGWPSRAGQLSELLAQKRPVRTCPLSDCSRAMKLGEAAPAADQKRPVMNVCFAEVR